MEVVVLTMQKFLFILVVNLINNYIEEDAMGRGVTVWFTGLSGSGKSTLAEAIAPRLRQMGRKVEVLDGDEVRTNLSKGLGFSKADRDTNIRRIGWVAKLLTRNGVVAITAAISPYKETRAWCRAEIGDFVEVFVDCPLEECEKRDKKGLYAKARAGEIKQFTGIDDPYESPDQAEVVVKTAAETEEESAQKILGRLVELGHLDPKGLKGVN